MSWIICILIIVISLFLLDMLTISLYAKMKRKRYVVRQKKRGRRDNRQGQKPNEWFRRRIRASKSNAFLRRMDSV